MVYDGWNRGVCLHWTLISNIILKYADASKLAPLGYTEIIPNVLIGYYFFGNFPDNWTFLGLLIIVISGIYISRREVVKKFYLICISFVY